MPNRYPGGKNRTGVYQRIISMMPPHDLYIEPFAGSGAIFNNKLPAEKTIIGEIDPRVIANHWSKEIPGVDIRNVDAFELMQNYKSDSPFWGFNDPNKVLIYYDPPYLKSVRSHKGKVYRFEMMQDERHVDFLELALQIPCRQMISGYDSELYNRILKDWRKEEINTSTRKGKVTEIVWLNFEKPPELHDYRYLGDDFHDRDRIKKKARRWVANLYAMPENERYAVIARLGEIKAEFAAREKTAADDDNLKRVRRSLNRRYIEKKSTAGAQTIDQQNLFTEVPKNGK